MRAGGCTVQQGLTVEAANLVKQAVALARRRGHAQVTPLHVANTMLSTPNGLLRTACLQSHSHPLQCKALELCFNVALNRLPASSSGPILPPPTHSSQQQYPTISNALVAAFKRAQAHQRRGSVENQQQALLAVKIELQQLIVSILDDPSVSRVMREAGFSSTQVKSNVEQAVHVSTLELCSSQSPPRNKQYSKDDNNNHNIVNVLTTKASKPSGTTVPSDDPPANYKDEDVVCVLESLMKRGSWRSVVIVGECVSSLEGVVGGVMDKVDKRDDVVAEGLREVKFISVSLNTFGNLQKREEVEQKIGELRCLVRSLVGKGVVLYLGDLKWIVDYRASTTTSSSRSDEYYCPVEHIIMELGRLIHGMGSENGRLWLIGIATFQTYMRCRSSSTTTGQRSLQTIWGLHPITLPAGTLDLSLSSTERYFSTGSETESSRSSKIIAKSSSRDPVLLGTIGNGSSSSVVLETEVGNLQNRVSNSEASMSSSLPSWLKDEAAGKRLKNNDQAAPAPVQELSQLKYWNSICSSSVHKQTISVLERNLTFSSSPSPSSSSTSFFSHDHQQHNNIDSACYQLLDANKQHMCNWDPAKQAISPAITTSSTDPNSAASSSDLMAEMDQYIPRFKDFNAENLNILCNALEQKVPWQKDVVPDIAGTILQCRSGMLKRKEKMRNINVDHDEVKEETWLFFQGLDVQAKERIARELAKVVFGSYSNFVTVNAADPSTTGFSSSSTDPQEYCCLRSSSKRLREENSCSCVGRLAQEMSWNPHRVFLVEDVEQADFHSQMGIKRAIQRGKITNGTDHIIASSGGDHQEVSLCDAIIILSCESFNSSSRACSPPVKQKLMDGVLVEEGKGACTNHDIIEGTLLDLNISISDDQSNMDDDIGIAEIVDRRIVFKV